MRRLHSTFAQGFPGLGLVLIRLAVGVTACAHGIELLRTEAPTSSLLAAALHLGLGMLLVIGLWTPIAGALLALVTLLGAYLHPEFGRCDVAIGVVAAAMALIGPGRWSVDAWLFGWKRLEFRDGKPPRG